MKTLIGVLVGAALLAGCGDKKNPSHFSGTGAFSSGGGACGGDVCQGDR